MNPLRRALRYLRPYWAITLGAFLSLALVTAANLTAPQLLRLVIDRGIAAGDAGALLWAVLALLGVAVVRGLFSFTQGFWSEKVSQAAAYDMRNDLFAKIQGLSFSYHDRAQTGQLMTRITSDVEQVRSFIAMGLLQLFSAVAMLVGSIGALVAMNWRLALVALLTVPAMALTIGSFMRVVRPLFGQIQARLGALNTVLQENIAGVRVVQAFAREPHEWRRYSETNEQLLEVNVRAVRAMSLGFPLTFLFANLGTLAVVWYGGHQVIGGALSIGELVAFNTYLALLTMPLMMLGMIAAQLTRAGVSAERIFEVLDAEVEVRDRPGAVPLPPVRGRVAFEDVRFGYGVRPAGRSTLNVERPAAPHNDRGEQPSTFNVPTFDGRDGLILNGVSFVAEPGMTVAILGETGSGKSTIINLIPRFYDVSGGRVTIDGYDVRDVTVASLREQIGIVLQDTTLFSGTIRDNIAYGRPDASDEQVEAAARAAQAHDFIAGFPDGYATLVGERGVTLSGGQRQRIAIARALLRDPRILILDDSTSAVDAETEYQIQRALETLMRGRTSFVIAQRISTVRAADLILLLDRGRIVAQGTHEQLLAESALYGEIIDSQFGGDRAVEMVEAA
ncbi:MAG TPA: ABC transporter ATP-binding protein [Roseiflexaceae bacterium]|nr:ABC transporter ATP-binding protein [Roseiflexaceae bacterium]